MQETLSQPQIYTRPAYPDVDLDFKPCNKNQCKKCKTNTFLSWITILGYVIIATLIIWLHLAFTSYRNNTEAMLENCTPLTNPYSIQIETSEVNDMYGPLSTNVNLFR